MTIRKLFPLLLVAAAAVVLMPEPASAQCWSCDVCNWKEHNSPDPSSCYGRLYGEPLGYTNCHEDAPCECEVRIEDYGFCWGGAAVGSAAEEAEQLKEALAAISAGRSISADGPFIYLRQGADYVVRRRCDAAEMGRVAVAEVQPVPVVGAG